MNVIENVFEWLLAATLRASVLAVVILCIQLVLRRWLPAGWRHALWLPMVAVLVLPVLPAAPFGLFPLKKEAAVVLPDIQFAAGESSVNEAVVVSGPLAEPRVKVNYLALAWLAGACGMLGAGVLGYRGNMARVRAAATRPDVDLAENIEIAALQSGLGRAPEVIVSPAVNSPAVTGFLRPVLLLPAGFPAGFSHAEARLILLHEFSHLKRLDLPLNWLACVLQAMHWFNPLLWFAFARMRVDREAACDARVLSLDAADNRSQYGGALLKLQCVAPTRALSLGFVGIFERGSEMKARIRDISTHRPGHFGWQAAGGVILTGLMMFGVTRAQEEAVEDQANHVAPGNLPEVSTEGSIYIVNKLRAIVVPNFEFEDGSIEEAVEFLRLRANQLDVKELDPAKKGINFVVRMPRKGQDWKAGEGYGRITLKLQNASLGRLLSELVEQAGARYKVDDFAVTVFPKNQAADNGIAAAGAGVPGAAAAKVDNDVIIPSAEFLQVPLREAVKTLNALATEAAKGKPVPVVVLDKSADPDAKTGELRLRNVPISVVVKYVAQQTKHKVAGGGGELRITKNAGIPDDAPSAGDKDSAKGAKDVSEAAMKIVIQRVDFEDVTLAEAVDFLNLKAKENGKELAAPVIVLDASADPTARIRELRIRNVPLPVALKYCTEQTKHKVVAVDGQLRLVKEP